MKFFHLSDLHIGKQLHHYNLREEQISILEQITAYAEQIRPDVILLSGDVYDKSVPSAEAVTIFDDFLTRISRITPQIPILIISGNHDSGERLEYAAKILEHQKIYLAGKAPESPKEFIKKVVLTDDYGNVNFYLLPFLKPSHVRNVFDENAPESYNAAVEALIRREEIDESERNVLLSHQFYIGRKSGVRPEVCDSETVSVGGIDEVDVSCVEVFDYVALGHLHGRQQVTKPTIRYCGTPYKYSVSEEKHKKSLTVVTMNEKNAEILIEEYPLKTLRDVRKLRGTIEEVLANPGNTDDYVSITLTDEIENYCSKEQLEDVFSHILEVRVDNARTRAKIAEFDEKIIAKDPYDAFCEFFVQMQGRQMNEEEQKEMQLIFEEIER